MRPRVNSGDLTAARGKATKVDGTSLGQPNALAGHDQRIPAGKHEPLGDDLTERGDHVNFARRPGDSPLHPAG
jgi:hypothetical protein